MLELPLDAIGRLVDFFSRDAPPALRVAEILPDPTYPRRDRVVLLGRCCGRLRVSALFKPQLLMALRPLHRLPCSILGASA